MNPVSWRQSSYCQESASCVNVARGERDTIMLRESEQPEVVLSTTRARLRTFIRAAKAGQLDHVTEC
ncbi:DUF397 domain-containing protein [Streptomyces luomodiensis]|uniref:DUF397 domain-containing protein n=1 Tax=Streptomyces luomodiensis TaxID=3026192 RepID=A0ABY9V2Z9_9ACTN|nr:DUF397 domain-containing protein [Streptomyces sp. SCA4-21]WNE98986.1 DUF397 domain-containing protein [Streptomyces sp. SCA4-21]